MMNVNVCLFSETRFPFPITKHVCFLGTSCHVVNGSHVMSQVSQSRALALNADVPLVGMRRG